MHTGSTYSDTESANYELVNPDWQPLIDEPETARPVKVVGKPFKPGVSGNPAGRPKRGQSFPEKLRTQTDRRADKIIDGILTQAEKGNTRAFIAVMDRTYGVPATKLVIEQADNPAADLLMRMMAHRANSGALPAEVLNDRIVPQLPIAPGESIDTTNT